MTASPLGDWRATGQGGQDGARVQDRRSRRARHHGCGHRRGVRPRRAERDRRGGRRGGAGARPGAHPQVHRQGGEPGQADRGRARRDRRPGDLHGLPGRPGRRRPGDRGDPRGHGLQARPVHRPRPHLRARHRAGDEHLVPLGHRDRGHDLPPRSGHRHALLQPRPGDEARRGRTHGGHGRRARGRRRRARPAPRQDPGDRGRPGRVRGQPAAPRLPQPRRDAAGAPRGIAGRHRHRDEARRRPSHGAVRAARPHRAGHLTRGLRGALPGEPRPRARAGPHPARAGHRRAARAQERAGLPRLRRGARAGRLGVPGQDGRGVGLRPGGGRRGAVVQARRRGVQAG